MTKAEDRRAGVPILRSVTQGTRRLSRILHAITALEMGHVFFFRFVRNQRMTARNEPPGDAKTIFCIFPFMWRFSLDQHSLFCYRIVRIDQTADLSLTLKIRFESAGRAIRRRNNQAGDLRSRVDLRKWTVRSCDFGLVTQIWYWNNQAGVPNLLEFRPFLLVMDRSWRPRKDSY